MKELKMQSLQLLLAVLLICNFVDASVQAGTCGSKRKNSAVIDNDAAECGALKAEIDSQIESLLLGVENTSFKVIYFHNSSQRYALRKEIDRIEKEFLNKPYDNEQFPKEFKAIDEIMIKALRSLVITKNQNSRNKIVSDAAQKCMDVKKEYEFDRFIDSIL